MSFVVPNFSRKKVSKAGNILLNKIPDSKEFVEAFELLNHWRACHAYPINTFQATLRQRLKNNNLSNAIVAQRLKRTPSILTKLQRNPGMQMARMQDIGGLRAIVNSISQVEKLKQDYLDDKKLTHEIINHDDYINNPKDSGYRSFHIIFKYKNSRNPIYNDLCIELQIRTKLQHAWATSVETIGTYLNQSLKSSEGSQEWLDYFKIVSAGFSHLENCACHQDFIHLKKIEIYQRIKEQTEKLDVISKLKSFSIATKAIENSKSKGKYHLIILDAKNKSATINSFSQNRLDIANEEYSKVESEIKESIDKQVVLVATDSIKALKKAYPNYFLDTDSFIKSIRHICQIL